MIVSSRDIIFMYKSQILSRKTRTKILSNFQIISKLSAVKKLHILEFPGT